MPQRRRPADEDAEPVMVPRNTKPLVPVTAARVRRLREHLVRALWEARGLTSTASPHTPEPAGFATRVAHTACALCKGWCCRNGADDGFLEDRTIARVRKDRPELNAQALLRLYVERVPATAYQDSCVFHGKLGCTLDRSLRADVCNSYFCGGLSAYLKTAAPVPAMVIAGEGEEMRTSPVLTPHQSDASPTDTIVKQKPNHD
jgi:hypothetical protein